VPKLPSDREDQPEAGMKIPVVTTQTEMNVLRQIKNNRGAVTLIPEMNGVAITIPATSAAAIKVEIITIRIHLVISKSLIIKLPGMRMQNINMVNLMVIKSKHMPIIIIIPGRIMYGIILHHGNIHIMALYSGIIMVIISSIMAGFTGTIPDEDII